MEWNKRKLLNEKLQRTHTDSAHQHQVFCLADGVITLLLQMAWRLNKTAYLLETYTNEMDCVKIQSILEEWAILLHQII